MSEEDAARLCEADPTKHDDGRRRGDYGVWEEKRRLWCMGGEEETMVNGPRSADMQLCGKVDANVGRCC